MDSLNKKMQSSAATKEVKELYYKWELIPLLYDRTNVDSLILKINKGGLNPKMGALIFQSLFKVGFDLSKKLSRFIKSVHIITGMYEQPEQFYSILFKILSAK